MDIELNPTRTVANDQEGTPAAVRDPVVLSTEPSRLYVAIDMRSTDLLKSYRSSVARAYAEIFNEVPDVTDKWSIDLSRQLVDQRIARGSTGLTLTDNGKIFAAAFIDNVPSSTGFTQSQADLLVHPDYRQSGLGRDLYLECMILALHDGAALAKKYGTDFNADNVVSISQTYKKSGFPREWWERVGYKVEPMFGIAAQEVFNQNSSLSASNNNILVKEITRDDFARLIAFMSSPQTVTSDGVQWSEQNARAYLKYMHRYNEKFIRMATLDGEVVGLLTADTIPRRNGINLHQFNGFFKPDADCSVERIAATLLQRVVDLADMSSKFTHGDLPLKELEFEKNNQGFFRRILPSIAEDGEFVVVKEKAVKIIDKLAEKAQRPRIAIYSNRTTTALNAAVNGNTRTPTIVRPTRALGRTSATPVREGRGSNIPVPMLGGGGG